MSKEDLINALKQLQDGGDEEINHELADRLLLDFINDNKITEEFDKIKKWYA